MSSSSYYSKSHPDTIKQNLDSDYEEDFEHSLLSSTRMRHSTPCATHHSATHHSSPALVSARSRRSVSVSSVDNTTYYKSDLEETIEGEPETEWEKWILRKAKELSFSQEKETEKRREERRKRKEAKRKQKEKRKQEELAIGQWNLKKLEEGKLKKAAELAKKTEVERKKKTEKEEILEKSIIAVKDWRKKKITKFKESKESKENEQARMNQLKKEREANARAKYEEWLRNHKAPKSVPRRAPKTLDDVYRTGRVKGNPEPWNSQSDVQYPPVKVLYTPFL